MLKSCIILFFITILLPLQISAQIGIGTLLPHSSSILHLESTTKGFLPPRLTTIQRDLINNPAHGLTIFNRTTLCIEFNRGTPVVPEWVSICSGTTEGEVSQLINCSLASNGSMITGNAVNGVSQQISLEITQADDFLIETSTINNVKFSFSGTLNPGIQTITLTATGVPTNSGTHTYTISIDNQVCNFSRTVGTTPSNLARCGNSSQTNLVEITSPYTGKVWMDRNMGASRAATSGTDQMGYGCLYLQFANIAPDLTWTSTTGGTYSTNPSSFAHTYGNPCPTGFRIPTTIEWRNEWNGIRIAKNNAENIPAGNPAQNGITKEQLWQYDFFLKLPFVFGTYGNGNGTGTYAGNNYSFILSDGTSDYASGNNASACFWLAESNMYASVLSSIPFFNTATDGELGLGGTTAVRCIKD